MECAQCVAFMSVVCSMCRFYEWSMLDVQLPPPSIDFTLPSPTIGLPKASLSVVDPPWLPHLKTKIEEVTINQEETVSF